MKTPPRPVPAVHRMSVRLSRAALACILISSILLEARALAAPDGKSAPATATAARDDQEVAAKKKEAQAYFEKGLAHYEKEEWDAALAQFERSRATYPTRAATKNAAYCLRKLRRLDDALAMFEEMLAFSNLPKEERALTEAAIAELRKGLGTLRIEGGAAGASLVVDGRYRGNLPLPGPLRVTAGMHEVRAFKEGQDPFGATVEVVATREAVVKLGSLSTGGLLKVTEERGRALDVVIDGRVMGKTPWEGSLPVGEHVVTLRGSASLDAIPECAAGEGGEEGKRAASPEKVELGTQPVSVPIRLRQVTQLTLTAEALDTSLRIEPTPGGAVVAIDSVVVGRGAWEGRLRVGEHKVEVMADGFAPDVRRVKLLPQKRQVIAVELEREVSASSIGLARNVSAGVAFGLGALGLGTFGVSLALAKGKVDELKVACPDDLCPRSQQANLVAVHDLQTISTVGLVVGGIGVAAGTVVLVALPSGPKSPGPASAGVAGWRLAVGAGQIGLEGSF